MVPRRTRSPAPNSTAESLARHILSRPPRTPRQPALFSSNTLFGQPGIYPQGPPMVPAPAPQAGDDATARTLDFLRGLGAARANAARVTGGPWSRGVEEPALRGALALLGCTLAAPLAEGFGDRTTVRSLSFGVPADPGRVVGPPAPDGVRGTADPAVRVVNGRYRDEHPAHIAPALAHDLLWSPGAGHAAETLLHALSAMVYLQLVARLPVLAHLGTELCRRQNSLAISLCNSRQPGSARITLVAPDGPGTIPGGSPAMQTPDFWSIPFAPVQDAPAPDLAAEVFGPLVADPPGEPGVPRPPFSFGEAYGHWFGRHLGAAWLRPVDQLRVSVALGLIGPEDLVDEAGRPVDPSSLGVTDALAAWG